jgi:transcription elongation GreA/GreB family factor
VTTALAHVREALPDRWADLYAAAMMGASEDACEWIADELANASRTDCLANVANEVLRRPEQSMAATFWLWKAAVGAQYGQAFVGVNLQSLTIRFLLAADDFARRAVDDKSRRPVVNQIRAAVAARDGALLRAVLEASDDRQAKDIRAALERNACLTDAVRTRSLDIVRKTHPSHFAVKMLDPWEDDTVIYTTQQSLRTQEEIYGELVTKKILDNQRAIAAAAEHGDITENAEFTAALEERDRLAERAGRLQMDIAKAHVISGSMAASETVTVGSRVWARNLESGEEETLIFLGPWDADISKHIYYYRAAMSLAFMGKAVGATVVLKTDSGERRWEILEIGPWVS